MEWSVPLSDLAVDNELLAAVNEAVASGWWSMGPRVRELEDTFAATIGTPHALAVANGTAALHLALLAVGCGPGDDVILPSLNFVAAANVVCHTGARPVFCDIVGPSDLNLDPADVESAVTPRAKAVLTLHYAGFPCDMDSVREIAARHGLTVVEDAAHAPGAKSHGRSCGTLGDVGCFSFFSNKNLPIGEGGMLATANGEVADRLRLLRSHGMTTLTWDRHRGHASSYDVVTKGFNYRLDEFRAALALVQLRRLEENNAARAHAAARYREALADIEALELPFAEHDPEVTPSHHLQVVVLPEGSSRDEVRRRLTRSGIQSSVHYPPIHRFSAYTNDATRDLRQTDAVAERLLTLPLFPGLTDAQVDLVANSLRAALSRRQTL